MDRMRLESRQGETARAKDRESISLHTAVGMRVLGNFVVRVPTFAPNLVCVYASILTNCRWVEAKISALGLGTGSGESQWCNRLPEVCEDIGGRFCDS
jgi:hypothetical protein